MLTLFIFAVLIIRADLISHSDYDTNIDKCQSFPEMRIIKPSFGGKLLVKRNENEFAITNNGTFIELKCSSRFPVIIDFEGVMPNFIEYTNVEVTSNDIFNQSDSCFHMSIGTQSLPRATGKYVCRSLDPRNTNYNSSLYIFATNGNLTPFLLHAKRIPVTELMNETKIIIPCITFIPTVIPKLFKGSSATIQQEVSNEMCNFEPSKGFICDITKSNNYNGVYRCTLDKVDYIDFNVNIPGFIVHPATESSFLNEEEQLTCESSSRVEIMFYSDTKTGITNPHIIRGTSYKKSQLSYYMHVAQIKLSRIKYNGLAYCIKAVQGQPKPDILYTWKIYNTPRVDSKPQNGIRNIQFDEQTNHFYCYMGLDFSPTISLIKCDNIVNCRTAKRFQTTDPGFSNKFIRGLSADRYFKQHINVDMDLKTEVAVMPNSSYSNMGVLECLVVRTTFPFGNSILYLEYFMDLSNTIITHMGYKNVNHVLRFRTINVLHEKIIQVYFQERVTFACEASAFVFATGLRFIFELNNSIVISHHHINSSNYLETKDKSKITLNETLLIWTKNITKIYCIAPKWNDNAWVNVSMNIMVKDSKIPEIMNRNSNHILQQRTFRMHERDGNISCVAHGIPKPRILWSRKEKALSAPPLNPIETHDADVVQSTLYFPEVSHIHVGAYICTAVNVVGETQLMFEISIATTAEQQQLNWMYYTIGGVAAFALLMFILVIVLFRVLKTQKKAIDRLTEAEIEEFVNGNEDLVQKYEELHDVAQYLPYKQEYEIHPSKIEIGKNEVLGTGNNGIVLKAVLEKTGQKIPVAVKTVKSSTDIHHLKILLSEIKIMMYLGTHRNIVQILGAMTRGLKEGKLFIAVEFCSNGNLLNLLRQSRASFVNQVFNDEIVLDQEITIKNKSPRRFLGIEDAINNAMEKRRSRNSQVPRIKTINLIEWCYQVANGMDYLGTKKVVHGDLATRNVLITDNLTAKITDFGLSRHLYEYSNYVKKQKDDPLPWRWLSLEAIKDSKFSTESDVWAYGITLWEMFTLGELPYQGFSWGEEFVEQLATGYRMNKPKYSTEDIHNTMLECWQSDPKNRPTFLVLKENFKELLQRYSWLDVLTETISATTSTQPEIFVSEVK